MTDFDGIPIPSDAHDVPALLAAGSAIVSVKRHKLPRAGEVLAALVPDGYRLETIDVLDHPTHKAGVVEFADVDSFLRYYTKHANGLSTSLFADYRELIFSAVFDDHGLTDAGWQQHVARFKPRLSPEFVVWSERDDKKMSQTDFAELIEENLPDIVDPPGVTMLSLALSLEAKKDVTFKSTQRLDNGAVNFVYAEDVQGSAQQGRLQMIPNFTLGIPVFVHGPAYRIEARVRYRIGDGGKLAIWYKLFRPHKTIEDAFAQFETTIAEKTGDMVMRGRIVAS